MLLHRSRRVYPALLLPCKRPPPTTTRCPCRTDTPVICVTIDCSSRCLLPWFKSKHQANKIDKQRQYAEPGSISRGATKIGSNISVTTFKDSGLLIPPSGRHADVHAFFAEATHEFLQEATTAFGFVRMRLFETLRWVSLLFILVSGFASIQPATSN